MAIAATTHMIQVARPKSENILDSLFYQAMVEMTLNSLCNAFIGTGVMSVDEMNSVLGKLPTAIKNAANELDATITSESATTVKNDCSTCADTNCDHRNDPSGSNSIH